MLKKIIFLKYARTHREGSLSQTLRPHTTRRNPWETTHHWSHVANIRVEERVRTHKRNDREHNFSQSYSV